MVSLTEKLLKALIDTSRKIAGKKNCHCVSHHDIYYSLGNFSCSGEEGKSFSEQEFLPIVRRAYA